MNKQQRHQLINQLVKRKVDEKLMSIFLMPNWFDKMEFEDIKLTYTIELNNKTDEELIALILSAKTND